MQGRVIRAMTIGSGSRRVLWIGGIHGDEREGDVATANLPAAFADALLGRHVTLCVIQDLNPDGSAAGTRVNVSGVDLNRNFPSATFDPSIAADGHTPLSQPESRLLAAVIATFQPALILAVHSWQGRPTGFVNYDGPARAQAERFAQLSGLPLVPSDALGLQTPGSLGSWAGIERHIAVLTIEFARGESHLRAWRQTRAAILAAIGSA